MTMSPAEFERLQYTRVSSIGYDLVETGDDVYPYRVEKHGAVVRDNLRSIQDVAVWVDHQEDAEAVARASFE
jgi:hypothetical protein